MSTAKPETTEELIARLRKENSQLKAAQPKPRAITIKVSEKGAVSIYGLNARFPVTLYRQQLEKLLDMEAELRAFVKANEAKLTTKGVVEESTEG
jgi:hypothetical protein